MFVEGVVWSGSTLFADLSAYFGHIPRGADWSGSPLFSIPFASLDTLLYSRATFLAHLSRRLIWWAYRIGRPPSSSSTLFKHLLLRNHWADQSHISYGASMGWGNESLLKRSWSHDQDGRIYDKNLKKSSLEPKGRWPWNLVCTTGYSSTTKFAQMITLGWPWPILRQGQIWSLMLLYGKKVKQWIFQKLLSSMIWN